jgi:hypothetical protein
MGVTQQPEGADGVRMILNLALARGWIGRDGCGVVPIRGHSSVQGGAEMGCYATALPGGLPLTAENAATLEGQYGFPIPRGPGYTAPAMVEAAHRGHLDVLYSVGGNLLRTLVGHRGSVTCLHYSPDLRILMSGGVDHVLNLWLPQRIAQKVLPSEKLHTALDKGGVWVHRLERISRPHRIPWLASPGLMDTINNLALIAAAVLLLAPFGLIPFSNTRPALALLFFAIGLLQRDGLFVVLGHLSNVLTVIYFTVLIVGGGAAIRELFLRFSGNS